MTKYNLISFIALLFFSFSSFNTKINGLYENDAPLFDQILQCSNFNELIALAQQDTDEIVKQQAQKTLLLRWNISYKIFITNGYIPALNGKRHLILEKIANKDFSKCDAQVATFYQCEFNNCNFSNAAMNSLTLKKCNFTNCDFTGACLNDARIKKTAFTECTFKEADLSKVGFKKCKDIMGCTFDQAKMRNLTVYLSTIKECSFNGQNSDLSYSNFYKSTILNTDFEEVNFCTAEILTCTLEETEFRSCQLLGAFITDSKLQKISFEKAALSNITFDNNEFFEVDISEATINPVFFNGTKIMFRSLQAIRKREGLTWQRNRAPTLIQTLGKRSSENKKTPSPKR